MMHPPFAARAARDSRSTSRPVRTPLAAVAIACAILGGCAATTTVDESVAAARLDDAPIEGTVATLTVHGMSCPLCANNVDQSLLAVPGVATVVTDMSTGNALVTLDGRTPVSRRQLADAVDRSGFSLVSIDVAGGAGS